MENICIIKEITRFNYGRIMFEKYFYYKTYQLAHEAKIQLEKKENERTSKSKMIIKIPYSSRTGDEICFESNNGFYNAEYSLFRAQVMT